jgi:hypothetical protein
MMASLADSYRILQGAGMFLKPHELEAFDIAVYQCLANYQLLAHCSMSAGLVRYNVVQKHHMLAHIPQFARSSVNPRLVATYSEESFVGQGQLSNMVQGATCKLLVHYSSLLGLAGMQDFRVHLGIDLVVFGWFRAPLDVWDRYSNRFDSNSC